MADAVRGILDGHIVLDRAIAERGRFPAINILKSVSRVMPACNTEDEQAIVARARAPLAVYEDMAELIRLGAYKSGTNAEVDAAIELFRSLKPSSRKRRKSEPLWQKGMPRSTRSSAALERGKVKRDETTRYIAASEALSGRRSQAPRRHAGRHESRSGTQAVDLEDSVARERQRANDTDIGRLAFPSFLRSIDSRRENLRATLGELEREREQAQGELTSAFQDLKSLELAMEQQAKRNAELQARRGQSRMDEMALVRHLRKHALRQA